MSLKIFSVEHPGEAEKESVWLDVLGDTDLSHYMVCDTTYAEAGYISNELRHMYWFAPQLVRKGDWVRLVTASGKDTKTTNNRGTTTHTIYWGLGRTIWNKDGDCAVLFHLSNWATKKA